MLVILIIFRTSDNERKLPPKPILLTQTFDDVEWLSEIGKNDLSKRIPNTVDRNRFETQAKRMTQHVALEEAITGRLSTMEILDLKREVNELDKITNKLLETAKQQDKMYFKQYINRIKELNQKVDYLEVMAS